MTSPNRRFLLASLICAALASLLFIPGIGGGFVFDDVANITSNPAIQMDVLSTNGLYNALFGRQAGGITRVIPTLSFALDYWRGGGFDPAVYKTTNIVIHAITALVLAGFFRTLLPATGMPMRRAAIVAIVMAMAWAIHPLQVSSVLYVVQRMQTLCTLFIVLALWAYLKARLAQIAGEPGRTGWLLSGLLWALALACKEDAALLPLYTLALELTVLQFRAADASIARVIRCGYLFATIAGVALFLFVFVPNQWSWDAYRGRDFNSWERLLTQGRVLVMYLWEILLPLPSHMPFYYDWLQPSRGLLQPWTTLPALLCIIALLAAAWSARLRHPIFSLGIFLFFAGHSITSNVLGLEMAFEHRNHFPLIGIVLAASDALMFAAQRLQLRLRTTMAMALFALVALGVMTVVRARSWSTPLDLAKTSTKNAPHSARAWNSLCSYYYDLGGGRTPKNPYLDKAIETCALGASAAPYSLTNQTNLVVFKSMRGTVTQADWDELLARMKTVNQGPENDMSLWVLINNARNRVAIDEGNLFKAIEIVTQRRPRNSVEYATLGYFISGQTHEPEKAYFYFARSIETSSPRDRLPAELIDDLQKQGRNDWAIKLRALKRSQDRERPQ